MKYELEELKKRKVDSPLKMSKKITTLLDDENIQRTKTAGDFNSMERRVFTYDECKRRPEKVSKEQKVMKVLMEMLKIHSIEEDFKHKMTFRTFEQFKNRPSLIDKITASMKM